MMMTMTQITRWFYASAQSLGLYDSVPVFKIRATGMWK